MSRRIAYALGIVALLVLVAALLLVRNRDGALDTVAVTTGTIDVTIQTVGTVQAVNAEVVRASTGGVIETLGVRSGDVILAGDIIAILDQAPFTRAIGDAQAQLIQAEFALQLAEHRTEIEPDNEDRRFEALAAADRVERAERAVADARQQQRRSVVLSARGGTVLEVQVRVGDAIGANQPVARVAFSDDFRLVADVDEIDLPNVGEDAPVRFRLDAYPATEIEGRVDQTAPIARQQGGATVFATTILFEVPASIDVRPGMNADVTIVTDAREGVLLIPERALRTIGDRSFVEVVVGGDVVEREVTLGYRGQGQVEIVAGLAEGDRVVLR